MGLGFQGVTNVTLLGIRVEETVEELRLGTGFESGLGSGLGLLSCITVPSGSDGCRTMPAYLCVCVDIHFSPKLTQVLEVLGLG